MNKASPKITPRRAVEPEVLVRARSGDRVAFAALYNETQPTVFRYIRSHIRDHATAEDLTSETFIRALRRIGTFKWTGQPFEAWVTTIARNLVADHYKAARNRYEAPVGDMLDVDRAGGSAEDLAVAAVLRADARRRLNAALARIAPRQAKVIRLRFVEDLSVAETAAAMGVRNGAAKTTCFRALASVRSHLADLRGAA